MAFADADPGFALEYDTISDPTFHHGAMDSMGLGEYLKRPVLIDTTNWVEGATLGLNFNPWRLFLTNPAIKAKIDSYGLLRMKLRCKFITTASPFYYGMVLVSYLPLPNSVLPVKTATGDRELISYSQRPHLFLQPQTGTGGEMELPFFWYENWIRNWADADDGDFDNIGRIRYDSFGELRNANSTAGANITIKCYVWAEDVEMSGPTARLQGKNRAKRGKRKIKDPKPMSKMDSIKEKVTDYGTQQDEYGDGPVSGIASAVARAGAELSNVPIIGPFARATQIAAGTASRLASWFGFSKIPVIDNVLPFKDLPFGSFATSEVGEPSIKLSLDPKCELTIDSRTCGLDGTDELALENYVTRESFLRSFEWTTTDGPGDSLFFMNCTPEHWYGVVNEPLGEIGDVQYLYHTPLSHCLAMYKHWTGDLVVRFQVISSQFHRGRLRVSWDPFANLQTGLNDTYTINHIYDIAETKDIEICIPYMQPTAYVEANSHEFVPQSSTYGSSVVYDIGRGNGMLAVSVANELTSPVADAPVTVVVSVRAATNFGVMNPIGPPQNQTYLLQGSDRPITDNDAEGEMCDELAPNVSKEPLMPMVYGGETNVSLRQLMQRMMFWRFDPSLNTAGSNAFHTTIFRRPLFPIHRGFPATASHALDTANSIPLPFVNYVGMTYLNWITPAFCGWRGSISWAMDPDSGVDSVSSTISRSPTLSGGSTTNYRTEITTSDTNFATTAQYPYASSNAITEVTGGGTALFNARTQTGCTVTVPFVSNHRFAATEGPYGNAPNEDFQTFTQTVTSHPAEANTRSTNQICFVGAGPDFNVFFYHNVPTVLVLDLLPPL